MISKFQAKDFLTSASEDDYLGRGSFASVRICSHPTFGNVVVKYFMITGSKATMAQITYDVEAEANVLCRLQHENIIRCFGTTQWSDYYGLVMEKGLRYNMEDLLIYQKDKSISWPVRLKFSLDIAQGLEYLHYHNSNRAYIHGDLKPQNIVFDENLVAKIADFGAVSISNATGATASMKNYSNKQRTLFYSAPEFLKNPSIKRTVSMDVYSYAMVVYEIITRRIIFSGENKVQPRLIEKLIVEKGQKPNLKYVHEVNDLLTSAKQREIFELLKEVMMKCWDYNPNNRLSMKSVKQLLEGITVNEPYHIEHLKENYRPNEADKKAPLSNFKHSLTAFVQEPKLSSSSGRSEQSQTLEVHQQDARDFEIIDSFESSDDEEFEGASDYPQTALQLQAKESTSKKLKYLETAKELHASVEKSSLNLARPINAEGIYVGGGETVDIPDVESCLKLRLPSKNKNEDFTTMNVNELHDLQSRLMLFAGPLLYIDELKPSRKNMASIGRMWSNTIPQIIEKALEEFDSSDPALNVKQIVKSCIPLAMAKLQNESGFKGRNRMKILKDLCFNKPDISETFLKLLVTNVKNLLISRNLQPDNSDNLIVNNALSAQGLQESGSFENVVWLYLQNRFASAIAKLVAAVDADQNLNLLENHKVTDLWLQMFESGKFMNMTWSVSTSFLVKSHSSFDCKFPFSRFIFEMLMKQWMLLEKRLNKPKEVIDHFYNFEFALLDITAQKSNLVCLVKVFIEDSVHFLYKTVFLKNSISDYEKDVIHDCVFHLFQTLRNIENNHNPFLQVFALLQEIKENLRTFSSVVGVNSNILQDSDDWITQQSECNEFILHKLAFCSLLDKVKSDTADQIGSVSRCEKWKDMVIDMKDVADSLVPLLDLKYKQLWRQILFVDLFLEQLIPPSIAKEVEQKYLTTLIPLAKRLWKSAEALKSLSSLQFLKIFTITLHGCKKTIKVSVLCNWDKTKCELCKNDPMTNPVKLGCKYNHFVCLNCIPQESSDITCPRCREKVTLTRPIESAKLTLEENEERKKFELTCSSFLLEYFSTFCFVDTSDSDDEIEKVKMILKEVIICDQTTPTTETQVSSLSDLNLDLNSRSYILQLLLHHNSGIVEDQLNDYFKTKQLVQDKRGSVIKVYMQCIQSLLQVYNKNSSIEIDVFKHEISEATKLVDECRHNYGANFSQLQHLEFCVKLQYIVRVTVLCIHNQHHHEQTQAMKNLVENVTDLCQNPLFAEMRQFIIKEFCRQYGLDAFQNLLKDETCKSLIPQYLLNAHDKTQKVYLESDYLDKPLARLVYELDSNDVVPDGIVRWNSTYLWKYQIHPSIEHLTQKLEVIDANSEAKGSILKSIIQSDNFSLIQHLETILRLQSTMIKRYGEKIDLSDADKITMSHFLQDQDYFFVQEINLYIQVWNKIRGNLAKCKKYKSLSQYFDKDLSLRSPISMCLPTKRGRGRCAYVMVEYLIEKQTEILQKCRAFFKPQPSFSLVDASECTRRDIICFNKHIDLLPLLQATSNYDVVESDLGSKQILTYDVALLEKKVVEKFVLRKSEIKCETVPHILYPQDVGFSKDCNKVLNNPDIKQVSLPARMSHDLDDSFENATTAKICEAVRSLTLVIQFLAQMGANAEQTICDYSEKELLIPSDETEMIPRSALMCHCLALYERMSWHRSKRLLQNGQHPFENVLEFAEDIEDDDVLEELMEELRGMNNERLQLELNALIMVGPDVQPEWRLGEDVLYFYLESKEVENNWCLKIPEGVLYKHAEHVFRLSVQVKEGN